MVTPEEWHWWKEGFDYGLAVPFFTDEQVMGIPREYRKVWSQGFDAAQIRRSFGLGAG